MSGRLFLHCPGGHAADVSVPLVGDDGLRVVVQLFFALRDVLFQAGPQIAAQGQLDLLIPLEDLDGVPPQASLVHQAGDGLLDAGQGVLHAAGEHMGQLTTRGSPGCPDGGLRGLPAAQLFQGAHLHHRTAQRLPQPGEVDPAAALPHQIHHVHRHHHWQSQLYELGGEVQVPLNVGAVHDVQNGVRPLIHQVSPGHHLLQRIGGEGVDPRQVLNDHVPAASQPSLLLLHGDAGPVAHRLIGAGQVVEQGGFAAVRIARQRNSNVHLTFSSLKSYMQLTHIPKFCARRRVSVRPG